MVGQRILCRNARERDQHGSDSTLQDTGHGAYEVRASAVLLFFARLKFLLKQKSPLVPPAGSTKIYPYGQFWRKTVKIIANELFFWANQSELGSDPDFTRSGRLRPFAPKIFSTAFFNH